MNSHILRSIDLQDDRDITQYIADIRMFAPYAWEASCLRDSDISDARSRKLAAYALRTMVRVTA